MNDLDSRALGPTDCYGQRFMRAGTFDYDLVPARSCTDEARFAVEVVEAKGKGKEGEMQQHDVRVQVGGDGRLRAEPERLQVQVGDMVMWHAPRVRRPYAVVGEKEFFSSQQLLNECGYSHAFGSPGTYRWVDTGDSGFEGVVHVADGDGSTDRGCKEWRARLRQGALVVVGPNGPEPKELEILTGQTVFFVVTASPGITITDERLARRMH